MKQTSWDWFIENLPIRIKNAIENSCQEIIEEAKKMNYQEISEAWNDGNYLGRNGNIFSDYDTGRGYLKNNFKKKLES